MKKYCFKNGNQLAKAQSQKVWRGLSEEQRKASVMECHKEGAESEEIEAEGQGQAGPGDLTSTGNHQGTQPRMEQGDTRPIPVNL